MISKFQSTLPTRGSDAYAHVLALTHQLFQSTLPTRGSDLLSLPLLSPTKVSIHAPHEGERLSICPQACTPTAFQSTLPTRGSDDNITAR